MIGPAVQALIAAIVWIVANVVYLDLRQKGIHGFTRFAAFWVGTPTTWITFFAVHEANRPTFEAGADDDERALLEAIRRDRELRGDRATERHRGSGRRPTTGRDQAACSSDGSTNEAAGDEP